jgi:PKD repeat protein
MIVADVFKVYLYADPILALNDYTFDDGEDITSGIINVDIQYGTDIYEGPQQQIDTGQFTIVSRNPNLDPKINANLKYNSGIKFRDLRSGEFFRGYVTDVQVEYQRKDNPIITITGTDIFGAMQRVVVDQDTHDSIMALSTGPTWNGLTFSEFIPYMNDFTSKYLELNAIVPANYPAPAGFWFTASQAYAEQSVGNLGYSPAKYIPQVGESYLDVINKYAQTNMTSFSAKNDMGSPLSYDSVGVSSFAKYDPNYWSPQQDPMLEYTTYDFSSDPADARPYQSILLNNGYNRVINQADISNEYRYVDTGELKSQSESFTRIASQSIEDYAISRASISTIYPEDATLSIADWADGYSENIFQVTQYPGQEIQQITFDNARYEDVENDFSYSGYDLNRIVRIKHEVNDNETIDRIYDIAGISHNISPDNWEMTFTLKPNAQEVVFNYQGSIPTLQMNATSGDANFNFTATLIDYDPATVSNVVWALSAIDSNEITQMWPYAYSGNMFKNGVPRTGVTQTWNFDDDGILAAYSFDGDSTFSNPLDNRFGGYGPGNWNVYAYIELTNGFTVVLQQALVVGTPVVEADFGWTQNLTNNFGQVTFIDTSVNHEVGEVDSYLWNFGDGTTSALQNPVHQYDPSPSTTTYSVSLTVYAFGEGGTKIYNTHTETVTLVQPTMVPDYTFVVSNSTVAFTNTSTNVGFEEPDAYLWNFGDGTTSTEKNPTHTYAGFEGQTLSYNVQLTTRNIWEQTASVTKTVSFTITFTVGNYGVTWIRLRPAIPTNYTTGTRFTPYIFSFKGLASQTNANLLFGKSTLLKGTAGQTWTNTAGGNVLVTGAFSNETTTSNLTGAGGLSGFANAGYSIAGLPWSMEINWYSTDTPKFNLKDFALTLRDVTIGSTAQWQTVFIDIYSNLGWTEVGFFATGKGPVGKNILGAAAGITEEERKVTLTRVLPINNLAFNYTFSNNNFTANFTTGTTGPWSWNFGDGTTSTLQNPSKTFTTRGIKYVTLTSASGTIIEPVNVLPVFAYNPRYIRIKQKLHDGTHQWDTPYIANLKLQTISGSYVSGGGLTNPQSIVSKRITDGTAWSSGYTGAGTFDPLNTQNLTNNTGLRFSTTNAGNTSQWDVVVDYKEAVSSRIHNITLDAAIPTVSGFAPTAATGISYEVFTTPYTGTFASATDPDNIGGGATWTKIGEINPTAMLQNKLITYNLIPS